MLDGVMLLWWVLTVPSFLFVVIDIGRRTPESPLMWALVIRTAFTGPLGAFFCVLGCREPFQGEAVIVKVAKPRRIRPIY
jgi:hypothetical protein